MLKLEGKVAVITGGSEGLGLATAQKFVAEGAYVFITGRRQDLLDAAVKLIGKNVTAVQGDITKAADIDRLYEVVRAEKGHIDVLFANAGSAKLVMLSDITEAHYYEIFDLNVKGVVLTVQKALPLLLDGASIILSGSMAGSTGTVGGSMYSASKAAVRSLARCWTMDLKGRGIRVNVIAPGPILTPGMAALGGDQFEDIKEALTAAVPMGRMGVPDEVATVALFLACEDSSYITGIELSVDGGATQV